VAKLEHS